MTNCNGFMLTENGRPIHLDMAWLGPIRIRIAGRRKENVAVFLVMALPRLDRGIIRATCRGTCWFRWPG
jgi:hypothetical protein